MDYITLHLIVSQLRVRAFCLSSTLSSLAFELAFILEYLRGAGMLGRHSPLPSCTSWSPYLLGQGQWGYPLNSIEQHTGAEQRGEVQASFVGMKWGF